MKSITIITDPRRLCGICSAARIADEAIGLVIGDEQLAEAASKAGYHKVFWFPTSAEVPEEAFCSAVSEITKTESPDVILSNDSAKARMLAACATASPNAAFVDSVVSLKPNNESLTATISLAGGIALEDIDITLPATLIYTGEDSDPHPVESCPIERQDAQPSAMAIVGTVPPPSDAVNLADAVKVIGVGRGLKSRDDLPMIEQCANTIDALIACTLPICDDLHWFGPDRVIGSSHNNTAPELYIAIGIAGAPNHVAGVRDAKTIVAINKDPEAGIFRNCKYGIVGDLYEVVPELTKQLSSN